MTTMQVSDVILDDAIYPRAAVHEGTVKRYAGLMGEGVEFPPIVIESGTGRLLDGWHRVKAAQTASVGALPADYHTVPDGVTAKLYAASLSAANGLPIVESDARELAREEYEADPSISIPSVARLLGRPRRTVQGWVQDISDARQAAKDRERDVRRYAASLLRELGWTQQQTADALSVNQSTIMRDGESANVHSDLDEGLLRDALTLMPDEAAGDVKALADRWREDRIFATWTDQERGLLKQLRSGETIVVSYRTHSDLITWADQAGLLARVDRKSAWGNPFEMGKDGDRDTVITNYATHYLPHKPSLTGRLDELHGKALACWCAPEPCHADVLVGLVYGEGV